MGTADTSFWQQDKEFYIMFSGSMIGSSVDHSLCFRCLLLFKT